MLQSVRQSGARLSCRALIEGIICPMIKWSLTRYFNILVALLLIAGLSSACNPRIPATPATPGMPAASPSSAATDSRTAQPPTPFQPSSTPIPLAALVNAEGLTLAAYQAEVARFSAALGRPSTAEEDVRVLDDLINQILLAQAAAAEGFIVTPDMIDERISALVAELGGEQALAAWMSGNGYIESGFRADLERAVAAAWMRDRITQAVPEQAEQIHARQILLATSDEATQVLNQLQNGVDFASLAAEYDPLAEGDLGWFPRGDLLDSKLDEAVFALQPGAISSVVQTAAGFHILQLIEMDPQHPLDPAARLALQKLALQSWLAERRSQSNLQIFIP
jgi:peptidyl-prolyl cis-trans isomerase C